MNLNLHLHRNLADYLVSGRDGGGAIDGRGGRVRPRHGGGDGGGRGDSGCIGRGDGYDGGAEEAVPEEEEGDCEGDKRAA